MPYHKRLYMSTRSAVSDCCRSSHHLIDCIACPYQTELRKAGWPQWVVPRMHELLENNKEWGCKVSDTWYICVIVLIYRIESRAVDGPVLAEWRHRVDVPKERGQLADDTEPRCACRPIA